MAVPGTQRVSVPSSASIPRGGWASQGTQGARAWLAGRLRLLPPRQHGQRPSSSLRAKGASAPRRDSQVTSPQHSPPERQSPAPPEVRHPERVAQAARASSLGRQRAQLGGSLAPLPARGSLLGLGPWRPRGGDPRR